MRADGLYKDALHLIDKGKIVLANNFINAHTPSTKCFLNQECISKPTSNSLEVDQQILQDDRVKFYFYATLTYIDCKIGSQTCR